MMANAPRLPTRLSPARQETLASFVSRCADANDIPISLVLKGCSGLTAADLTSRKTLPLSQLAHRLSAREDELDALCARHRLIHPPPRIPGLLQGSRWICPLCEAQGIRTHCEKTWLRFACEEHGVYLQVDHRGPQEVMVASDKALTLQARANMLLCDNTDAFFAGVRLLSLMKELQRLSKAVRPHEVQPGTRHVFEWLEQVQITREYYIRTPQHAAILLNSLLPIVNCRHLDEEIRRNLRVLCERRVNQDGREESVELARRQALEEIASLLLIGKRIAWLVDVHGLHEDDVPMIFIGRRGKVRHTLQSQDWWGRQGAPGMWNALRQSCNDVHEAVATYRMGPGSQAQSVLKAAERSRRPIGPTGGSPITPTSFAVELTQLLGDRRTRGARPGRIGLPGPAVKWLVPEIGASPGMRDVLEDWLWLQTLEPGPELRSDGVVPLEEIWRLDAQMTVEQKLQLLELRDSVIDDIEGRSRERFPEESTGAGTRQVQRGQHRAG